MHRHPLDTNSQKINEKVRGADAETEAESDTDVSVICTWVNLRNRVWGADTGTEIEVDTVEKHESLLPWNLTPEQIIPNYFINT